MNNDIRLAKEKLYEDNLRICIVKNGAVIFSSKEQGILPMYQVVAINPLDLSGASVADRVIGRAAAMLNIFANTKRIYCDLLSESAYEILKQNAISIDYKTRVPYILNRNKTDLCPIEKISNSVNDTNYIKLIKYIESFLYSINKIERKKL